jgi:hypothetical protein
MSTAPNIKRLVDLVDRGPEDDLFYPASSNNTVFRREWAPYHNMTPEIAEIGFQGNAAWGGRITVTLTRKDSGDMLQWLCLRLLPRSWLGGDLDAKIKSGLWTYDLPSDPNVDPTWMWAASLGTIAIEKVEFEIGDTLVETWPGEWMDIWSRAWMDGSRAAVWDSDIYAKLPYSTIRDRGRAPFNTIQPTEDGYVYCWLPLCFLRRPQTAFPLIAMGEQEVRVNITLRPFADVVRRRGLPRSSPCEVPLGETITLIDRSGVTPVPWSYTLPSTVPAFEDATVFVGVAHMEDPLRSSYMRLPMEIMYEPIKYMRFDITPALMDPSGQAFTLNFPLKDFNGPIREICFFLRRKGVWQYNEWTNYGSLLENDFFPTFVSVLGLEPNQLPILQSAVLQVGNATWKEDSEHWWRTEYALDHRGGVRLFDGMVYGYTFGDAAGLVPEDLQPAGTVNASRTDMRLVLTMQAPAPVGGNRYIPGWDVHVFGIGLNWMRFVSGMAVPIFKD